ncbi:MFS transporter [Neisseriaceae bacterium CLB008]
MSVHLEGALNRQRMTGFQWQIVGLCVLLNIIDGFDVMVMAFTAAAVSEHWGLSGTELGFLLSVGLLGMTAGSLVLAPWADRLGRRPLIMICLLISGMGMVASSFSQTHTQLGWLRFVTGLGIGGILASANVIACEYASAKWRNFAISLLSVGYALGATFGGLVAVYLVSRFGWQSVFMVGGVATLLMVLWVYWALPESLAFLLAKRPRHALSKVNDLNARLQLPPLAELPLVPSAQAAAKQSLSALLNREFRGASLGLWVTFFLTMFGFYFVMSWTPKLLTVSGLSAEQGMTGGILLSIGGIFGAVLYGLVTTRFSVFHTQLVFFILTAVLMVGFVYSIDLGALAFLFGLGLGVCVNGCVASLYAKAPTLYPSHIRTTGVGFGIGVGRIGGILSPMVAGSLLDQNWTPTTLYGVYALLFLLALLGLLYMHTQSGLVTRKGA